MASPRTRRVLQELKPSSENDVSIRLFQTKTIMITNRIFFIN